MCILFLHTDNNPAPNAYKLILASNRDEYFPRPTRQAHFWDEDSRIIGGQDQEPGREGGSWLAMSSEGRIAVLLNVTGENVQDPSRNLGRGFLVPDFVINKEHESQDTYLKRVSENGHKYNPFNFISIEVCSKEINIMEYSNGKGSSKVAEKVGIGTRGWGNSIPASPFRKVTAGTSRLKKIVETYGTTEDKETLVQELLSLLKWEERTHSIILIDAKGMAEYMEWTMKEPIDPTNPTWVHVKNSFQLTNW
ncbi:Transport and Golgi organization protein 2 [Blattella germanica]|nr:Transport and Golgi organization protein 2 [Blattella germanica]